MTTPNYRPALSTSEATAVPSLSGQNMAEGRVSRLSVSDSARLRAAPVQWWIEWHDAAAFGTRSLEVLAPEAGRRASRFAVLALCLLALAACVTGHEGVDMVTSVTLNSVLWGVP